jgi:hypothetical protein
MSMINDVACEQALLGAVLVAPDIAGDALRAVPKDAWWAPKHELLAAVINDMLVRGQPVDPTTVLGQLAANGLLNRIDGPFLVSLAGAFYVPENAMSYAERLIELHADRSLAKAVGQVGQRLNEDWERGDGIDLVTAIAQLRQACDDAAAVTSAAAPYRPTSLASLLEVEDRYNWLVPGLLERGERIVLTGAEGSGKSVLVSQFAAALCGGLHPFTSSVLGDGDRSVRVPDTPPVSAAGAERGCGPRGVRAGAGGVGEQLLRGVPAGGSGLVEGAGCDVAGACGGGDGAGSVGVGSAVPVDEWEFER